MKNIIRTKANDEDGNRKHVMKRKIKKCDEKENNME